MNGESLAEPLPDDPLVELWVQGDYRIHDRVRWIRSLRKADDHSFTSDGWTATRLQP